MSQIGQTLPRLIAQEEEGEMPEEDLLGKESEDEEELESDGDEPEEM